jgi:hypothetical protein
MQGKIGEDDAYSVIDVLFWAKIFSACKLCEKMNCQDAKCSTEQIYGVL